MTGKYPIAVVLLVSLLSAGLTAAEDDRPVITVLDFSTEGVAEGEMNTIIYLLSSALFQTGRYTVIDVSQRQAILKEIEFSVSDCSDESCLLEMGRMLSAEVIVVGNIGRVGTRYVLSTKMLETETARTLNTADGIYRDLDVLLEDIEHIAGVLAGITTAGVEEEDPSEDAAVRKPPVSPRKAAAYGTLAGGVGMLGAGSYLFISALSYILPMNRALEDYNLAESGTEQEFTVLYDDYLGKYNVAMDRNANARFAAGLILGGTGLVLGGVSIVLFLTSDKSSKDER